VAVRKNSECEYESAIKNPIVAGHKTLSGLLMRFRDGNLLGSSVFE